MEQQHQQHPMMIVGRSNDNEYDALLSNVKERPSSYDYGAGYNNIHPHPAYPHAQLATVKEESTGDLTARGRHWMDEKEEKEDYHEQQQQDLHHYPSATSASSLTSMWAMKTPNIHTKRGCRLWIAFGFVGIALFLFWGLPLEHLVKTDVSQRFAPRYDYIVVGGGPSGIITAVKLARKFPHLSVILLESGALSQTDVLQALNDHHGHGAAGGTAGGTAAGGHHPSDAQYCPALAAGSTELSKFDVPLLWSGVASSQSRRQVYGMEANAQHLWPVSGDLLIGRTLGGGGLLNAMIYVRSLRTDWERWNVTGWTLDDILPHYLALEEFTTEFHGVPSFYSTNQTNNNNNNNSTPVDSWRSTRGPIATVAAGYGADTVGDLFVQSAIQAGIPLAARGFNHIDPSKRVGVGMYEYNIRDGTRDSVAQALLGRRPLPPNLRIRTGHTATRILTAPPLPTSTPNITVRAMGVAFQMSNGEMGEYALTDASAEVILAAGAILTPQLLGQSDIGPGGKVLDLPGVGANCNDHPVVALTYEISPELTRQPSSVYTIGDEWEDYTLAAAELKSTPPSEDNDTVTELRLQIMNRLGTLGTAGLSAGGFLRSPWARSDDPSPDLQITVFPRVMEPHVTRERKRQNVKFIHSSVMLVTVALLDADARYVVKASVPGPVEGTAAFPTRNWVDFEAPRLDLPDGQTRYLSPKDVRRLAWGVQEVRRIMDTPPLSEQLREELTPGRLVQEQQDLDNFVTSSVLLNAHWVGTTRMGSVDDPMSVVDERLLVKGAANLRIVDAGVIPGAPNGNIHSTVTAVASRGADLIAIDRTQAISQ